MSIKLDAKTIGKKVANDAIKRTVGSALKDTNDVLDALLGTKKTDSVSTICFPSDIRNNAQSTYMVIYITDNKNNLTKFSNTIFNAKTDKYTYEIKALTWAKEYAKQELKRLEKYTTQQVKNAANWIKDEAEKLGPAGVTRYKERTEQAKAENASWWDVLNEWVIPHRVPSTDTQIRNELDPANNPGDGYNITKAIALQLPNSPLTYKNDYGWEAADTKTVHDIINAFEGIVSYATGFLDKKKRQQAYATGAQKLSPIWEKMKIAVGNAVTGGEYGAYYSSTTQKWENPMLVFNYKCPDPRTFTYNFSFAPRNKDELYDIYNIIALLRFYAAPDFTRRGTRIDKKTGTQMEGTDSGGAFVNYPAKFSIKFYTGGHENSWLHTTLALGLSSISETLTGENGDLAFFENYFDSGSGNPPRLINLSLTFKELGIITRRAINAGY